jgi:hypothetical protein
MSYECVKCGARISVSPDSGLAPPGRCVQCKEEWIRPHVVETYGNPGDLINREPPHVKLAKAIASMREPVIAGTFGFRVLLEFEEPIMQLASQKLAQGQ